MVPANGQANFTVNLEAASRGEKAKGWRAERVCGWQYYAAVIYAAVIRGRFGGSAQGEMPFKEVVF